MELSDWCEQVPHGHYFQPIRLRLDAASARNGSLAVSPSTSAVAPFTEPALVALATPPRVTQAKDTNSSPGLTTPKRLKRRQKPASTTPQTPKVTVVREVDCDGTVLLPPFQSAHIGANRMVLNVGGPVWAMDWLPHDVYRLTSVATSKSKKTASTSGAANKENVNHNVHEASADSREPAATTKDPLTEWRLLALATHPPCTVVDGKLVKNTPPDHHYDAPHGGRNLIQIWAVPVTKKASTPAKDEMVAAPRSDQQTPRMIPRLVFAIDHDSGVAWDVHWSPLTHKMARYRQSNDLLGLLAVAFGDGSLQVFEVPLISPDKLQTEPSEHVIERLKPIAAGKLERIIQLSVRWSPHRPNLLLTGCSDGSIALWNLEDLLSKAPPTEGMEETFEVEPQRRFQDGMLSILSWTCAEVIHSPLILSLDSVRVADTVGKQESFDWGWGWVAVRAVCWSPFDENLFATTGNDSLFKIWDIREPRICFRSHRIRSTWGLAMQWMDDTSVQISGDQGSLFMYDVLSGSYQKLHFHPQIDSPVWDLQFARRGRLPILLSSCTSGSLRVAPAKKIFRAPQHSVEFCRLYGEKNANVELPHKSLTLNFDHRIVSGSAEASSPATREFCERDASLHRVRLSTNEAGEFPCFLATGGHAGLVILMEMQEDFDNLFENYFLQSNKKIGRPRKSGKVSSPWSGRKIGQEKPKKAVAPPKIKRVSAVKLSTFAQASGILVRGNSKLTKAKEADCPEINLASGSPSEAEYQDGESESDSDEISLGDDNSDDDRVVGSDGEDDSDTVEVITSPVSSSAARMRREYQMDLSEEDAFLLAIQMSELDHTQPPQETPNGAGAVPRKRPPTAKKTSVSKKGEDKPLYNGSAYKKFHATNTNELPKEVEENSGTVNSQSTPNTYAASKPAAPQTKDAKSKPPPRTVSKKKKLPSQVVPTALEDMKQASSESPPDNGREIFVEDMDQTSIQMHIYQQGMTEEDALREALRISEMGHTRRSNRKRKAPSPAGETEFSSTPSTRKTQMRSSRGNHSTIVTPAVAPVAGKAFSPDEVTRRLEFSSSSPLYSAKDNTEASSTASAPVAVKTKQIELHKTPPLASKTRAKPTSTAKTKKAPTTKSGTPSANGVCPVATPNADTTTASKSPVLTTPKQPTRKVGEKIVTPAKATKKSPSTSTKKAKAKRASGERFLTDEELLAIALQTSQIEF